MKSRLAVIAALLVTLFVGRLWGASGRWELERALSTAAMRVDLLEAHASLLGAQASLCEADAGEMSQRLDDARGFVGRAGTRLGSTGLNDERLRLQLAGFGAAIDEAQRLAARLTRGASGASGTHDPALPVKISEKP
jgi:phage protein D